MSSYETLVTSDPDVLSGMACFKGTRVPVSTLLAHVRAGDRLEDVLDDFPSVSREQAVAVLRSVDRL